MKKKKIKNDIKINSVFIFIGFLFFIAIILRIGYLSLSKNIDGIDLQKFANSRTTKTDILYAKRGAIYDRNGDVLAQNVSSYTVIAYLDSSRTTEPSNPMHVVDKEYTAKQLSPILGISEEQILKYLSKEKLYQTELGSKGRGITELTKEEIEKLDLPGIDFIETQKRNYPYGTFLAYTLGYAKVNTIEDGNGNSEEKIVGELGVEAQFNKELSGTNGYTYYQKDRNGYKIAGTPEITEKAVNGDNIYLTIDSTIQLFVEQAIKKIETEASFDWLTMVVADAETGAILATSNSPTYDPNKRNIENYLDYSMSYAYEPGSTMKTYTYMATMENGNYVGSEKYKSGIYVTKDGTEIGDWDRNGWGTISFDQGYVFSSNVGIINLIKRKINGNILKDYLKKLGFGSKTGIELANEATGKVNFKYETEILNAGFGQGITSTPIQHIKALTSISNDGVLLKPYIIKKIVDDNNKIIYEGKKTELGTVASKETVEKIKNLMYKVTNGGKNIATGYYYSMPGYDLIGKTGTAQVPNEKDGGYYSDQTISSFSGMFPKDDPKIIIYVAAKNLNRILSMRDVVKSVVTNTSNYLNIYDGSIEEDKPLKEYKVSSYINKNIEEVKTILQDNFINSIILGDGNKIIKQYPSNNVTITDLDRIILVTNSNKIALPDLISFSSAEVKTIANLLNIKLTYEGNGYVYEQSIAPGTIVKENDVLKVKLKEKK